MNYNNLFVIIISRHGGTVNKMKNVTIKMLALFLSIFIASCFSVTKDTKTYTITYDSNGSTSGSIPVDSNAYEEGATATVLDGSTLVKTGYVFTGWNTADDASGKSYNSGDSLKIETTNIILYAKWTSNPTYKVTYYGNGNTSGTNVTDNVNYEEGSTVTVKTQGSLAKTGFSFIGWNTEEDGSGTSYVAGNTFSIGSSNITLFAQWTNDPTYTVTYNGNTSNGGTLPTDPTNYQQGDTVTVLAHGTLSKSGSTFTGWNTAQDGSGTNHAAGSSFQMGAANITLYAQWTSNPTYTVTYDGNTSTGGSAPTDSTNYQQADTVTVLAVGTLSKSGFSFTGWNTAQDGSGTDYVAGNTFQMGATNVTLYAQWQAVAEVYKINFGSSNSNFGEVAPGWQNNAMDIIPTVGRVTLNTEGVDTGLRIGIPSSSSAVAKKTVTNISSNNPDFPSAVMVTSFKAYSAFVNTGITAKIEISGLTPNHNYSFKILSVLDLTTINAGGSTYTTANTQSTIISIVGVNTVSNTLNPINNDATLLTEGTVESTNEGKIIVNLSAPINWGHAFINAMIISKE